MEALSRKTAKAKDWAAITRLCSDALAIIREVNN